ncbi:Fibronectin type III domain-containing protein, partial [Pedococcus cremeus]
MPHSRFRVAVSLLALFALSLVLPFQVMQAAPAAAADPCAAPVNVIACENSKPGTPSSDWSITGAGSPSIQGFATSISVNPGDTVRFKINTPSKAYHFDILRMGYYQGNGARKLAANLKPSATLPQTQPSCLTLQDSTGLIDCGNWAVSASWTVPTDAVSGVYIAHLVREDATGASHIVFIVKNDNSHSDLLFQTSDETWQAYNTYGGNSLYTCAVSCPPGSPAAYKGASKVSYNRPFHSAEDDSGGRSWLMYTEYPMIRFLEANGFDVSYTTGIDVGTTTGGSLLNNHKAFLSVGHDEYWSGTQRANVEAARDKGLNLAFFSGNEVFWKTRTEASYDGTSTPNRTLVAYKDTHYDGQADPVAWTGTWQDPRFSPPGDGGRPQNALTGQLFQVNSGTTDIRVPAQYSQLRFWRNTGVASLPTGQTLTLGAGLGTLGYEWDVDPDNGFRPAGSFRMSSTTSTSAEVFTDYGSTTKTGGTATHNLTLYRAPSGALVFGAGTVQWSWGLDPGNGPDRNMQQATVNLFADMGVQPYALLSGLTAATASTDTAAPTSTITSPAGASTVGDGGKITISGTAADTGGGVVAGVEVSTDDGKTWHPATGTTSWTYSWVAHGNPSTTIRSRAVDDSGNLETPSAGKSLNVSCTCSIWGTGSAPTQADSGSASAVEVGVKFRSDVSGVVTGVRFYKSSKNTGTHVGSLWTSSGTKLASATFTSESASGWQQVTFATPVAVNANTTYVASYFAPVGHTAQDDDYMYNAPSPDPYSNGVMDSPPLHALRNVSGTTNGVYKTSATTTFPNTSVSARNYWVDVMFNANSGAATVPGAPTGVSATPGDASAQVAWTVPGDGGSAITSYTVTPYIGTTAQTPTTVSGTISDPTVTVTGLTNGTAYTFKVSATNAVGTGPDSAASNAVTPSKTSCTACTIWTATTVPNTPDQGDPNATEIGTKFKADVNGEIKGIRFYKANTNTGTHIANLWTSTGTKLASATVTGETASGWQQVMFANPVTITAGTVYVASYFAPAGHYAADTGYFAASGVDNGPLHALKDGVSGGNGVYRYTSTSAFPSSTYQSEAYFVDVVFSTTSATAPAAPTNVTASAGDASASVTWTAPSDGGSAITSYTVTPYIGTTAQTPTTVTGNPPATTATVSGLTNGTAYTFKVKATNAVGAGPDSTASNTVTPTSNATAPAAPTNVTASAGDASASVTWTAPSNGGSAITSYTVTPYIGTTAQTPTTVTGNPPATTATVSGLTNGTAYTFKVKATNAIGAGPDSAVSNSVTPSAATAPDAPTAVTATAGNASATVSWTAPANGGSAITSYTVTPYIGTTAQTTTTVSGSPPATTSTVGGLTNGTAYTFKVTATNVVGTGPQSAASNTVTPSSGATAPGAPTNVTAAGGDGSATVSWTAPSDGGSAITSYTVTPYAGSTALASTPVTGNPPATTAVVSGLTNGTSYTFKVSATNAVGTGAQSAASNAVTPSATGCSGCTIWSASATPGTASAADSSAVELGVKFKADV